MNMQKSWNMQFSLFINLMIVVSRFEQILFDTLESDMEHIISYGPSDTDHIIWSIWYGMDNMIWTRWCGPYDMIWIVQNGPYDITIWYGPYDMVNIIMFCDFIWDVFSWSLPQFETMFDAYDAINEDAYFVRN